MIWDSGDTIVSYYHWFVWFHNTKEYSFPWLLRVSKRHLCLRDRQRLALVTRWGYTVVDVYNYFRVVRLLSDVHAQILCLLSWSLLSVALVFMADTPPRKANPLLVFLVIDMEFKLWHEYPQEPFSSSAHAYVKCCTGNKMYHRREFWGWFMLNFLSWIEYIWEYQSSRSRGMMLWLLLRGVMRVHASRSRGREWAFSHKRSWTYSHLFRRRYIMRGSRTDEHCSSAWLLSRHFFGCIYAS